MRDLSLVEEHAGTHALEPAEREVSELAAVERDFERAGAAGETESVQELFVPPRDFQEELPAAGVPVEGNESVLALQIPGAVRHGCDALGRAIRRARGRRGRGGRRLGSRERGQKGQKTGTDERSPHP